MPGMQLTIIRDRYEGHAKSPWLVVVPRRLSPTGRRRYRRFATKKSAQAFAASIRQQVQQSGEHPLATLPFPLAKDAAAAARLLEGTGLSLTQAVRQLLAAGQGRTSTRACAHARTHKTPPVLPTLGSTLALLEAAKEHQSAATKRTRRSTLRRLFARNKGLEDTPLEACTPAMLQRVLDTTCPHSAQAWNTARRYLHALFAACRPATAAERAAAAKLCPRERRLATADTTSLRPYIAICAFAGVRPAECSRLTWADIDWEDGILSVRAANSKTGGTRHIPLHATLRAWLQTCRPATAAPGDPIAPAAGLATRLSALRRRAGYGAGSRAGKGAGGRGGTSWARDVLRHSYATYYLKAAVGELSQLQYNMGHRDARLLYARYTNMRGVTKAAAQSWWQVSP